MDGLHSYLGCNVWSFRQWPYRRPLLETLVNSLRQHHFPHRLGHSSRSSRHAYDIYLPFHHRRGGRNVVYGCPSIPERSGTTRATWKSCRTTTTCYYLWHYVCFLAGLWYAIYWRNGRWTIRGCMAFPFGIPMRAFAAPGNWHFLFAIQSSVVDTSRLVNFPVNHEKVLNYD